MITSISAREKFSLGQQWRPLTTFTFKLPSKSQFFLFVLHFLLLFNICILQIQLLLLFFVLLIMLIKATLNFFFKICNLDFLLPFQCIQRCFYFNSSTNQPFLFFCFFELNYLLLCDMSFNIAEFYDIYFFCLTIYYSCFLKFKHSDDSFTFKGSSASNSCLVFYWSLSCFVSNYFMSLSPQAL